jgi:hypothetical protein
MDQVRTAVVVLALTFAAACDRPLSDEEGGRSAVALSDSALRAQPGYIVDTIHAPEEALRRFRAGLAAPSTLDGAQSRDELVQRFIRAFERRDRGALLALTITRAEFAYLIYPELSISKPPYRQPPNVAWLLHETSNGSAIDKLVNKAAERFRLLGYRCLGEPALEGTLRIWNDCMVRVREGSAERELSLFGRIVERDRRWKFIGMDNDL